MNCPLTLFLPPLFFLLVVAKLCAQSVQFDYVRKWVGQEKAERRGKFRLHSSATSEIVSQFDWTIFHVSEKVICEKWIKWIERKLWEKTKAKPINDNAQDNA